MPTRFKTDFQTQVRKRESERVRMALASGVLRFHARRQDDQINARPHPGPLPQEREDDGSVWGESWAALNVALPNLVLGCFFLETRLFLVDLLTAPEPKESPSNSRRPLIFNFPIRGRFELEGRFMGRSTTTRDAQTINARRTILPLLGERAGVRAGNPHFPSSSLTLASTAVFPKKF